MSDMIIDQPSIEFVSKGWGFEKIICNTQQYCGKLLFFAKGRRCSFHYHKIKDETFYIQSGKIKVYYSDDIGKATLMQDKWAKDIGDNNNSLFAMLAASVRAPDNDGWIKEIVLNAGDNFYIPVGRVHQMIAIEDSNMYEFSTTHMDDDSYRIVKGD